MGRLIIALISIPIVSFFLGMAIGEANSPNLSTEAAGREYVGSYATLVKVDEADVVLRVQSGTRVYEYSRKSNELTELLSTDALSGKNPRQWNSLDYKNVGAILGLGTLESNFATLAGLVSRDHQWLPAEKYMVAGAVIAATAGGIFGYWLRYSDTPDYDNANFKNGLSDKVLWQSLSNTVRACGLSLTPAGTVTMNRKQSSGVSAKQKSICERIVGHSPGSIDVNAVGEEELKPQPAK